MKKGPEPRTARRQRLTRASRIYVPAALLGLFVAGFVAYSLHIESTITRTLLPIEHAALNAKYEAIRAHLAFEEYLAGDPDQTLDSLWPCLDSAETHAGRLCMHQVLGVKKPDTCTTGICSYSNTFSIIILSIKDLSQKRLSDRSLSDASYDSLFTELILRADSLTAEIHATIDEKISAFHKIQIVLFVLCVVLFIYVLVTSIRFVSARTAMLNLLFDANRKLDSTNQQLTASEQQLKASNQQLTANEQQLRAANQQLQATEQQLRAANQQMVLSEGRYRMLIDTMQTAVAVYEVVDNGDDFIFKEFNKAAQAMEQMPREQVLGKRVTEAFPGVRDFGIFAVFQRVYRTGAPEHFPVGQYMDDRIVGWRDNYVYKLASGEIVAVYTDETKIKQAEEERKRLEYEMQKSQKLDSLGILAGGIAHDFNNMLSGLFGYIDMARNLLSADEKPAHYLDRAMGAFNRVKDLTNQLLTFAKGGSPAKKPVDLQPLIRDAAELAISGSSCVCKYTFAQQQLPCEADPGQISQLISNIVLNARQAMPGSGTIRIGVETLVLGAGQIPPLAPGNYARITIADTGVGIPREMAGKIFDPFFTTKQQGSGLGLAISYSIVKKHFGTITVESEPGKGSAISIYLPAATGPLAAEENAADIAPHGTGRILIMDDEPILRNLATDMLSNLGYNVSVAMHGEETLRSYKAAMEAGKKFDVVILDLTIPNGMGGKETLEQLKNIDPQVRAIVSSGYSNDPVLAHPGQFGFAGMAAKPYRSSDLAKLLKKLLA